VATVYERFSEALRALGNGQVADGAVMPTSPAQARAAEWPEDLIARASARALDVPYAESLAHRPVSHQFLQSVPIGFARRHGVVGLADGAAETGDTGCLTLALADLAQWPHLVTLSKLLGKTVQPLFVPRPEILRTINAAYQEQRGQADRVIEQLDGNAVNGLAGKAASSEDLLDVASRAPVIQLVSLVLLEAVKRRASDVHVQPMEDRLVVRFRIDGVLHEVFEPPAALHEEIISRIKVMGGMNIAERRLAQDGRATVEVGDRVVDLRIATLPTSFGERAVIRLLDKSARLYRLTELGMPQGILETFYALIRHDHGIVLVTGPTGSGKSTTLYAALQEIDTRELNVLTLEDPIEYRLEGISQTQVSEKKGMTFASGLRHVLRQDPDIIMVGEIRDGETARMAIQSALTGHLVFSTLHTNDAAGAVSRMLDLGVEPYLLASSLLGVLAQRLVRQICPACRTEYQPIEADRKRWGLAEGTARPTRYYVGKGCAACLETGYTERRGVFELLTVSETIRELILARARSSSIRAAALKEGMITLRADGIGKASQGTTTMDEVVRVTGREEF